MWLLSCGKLTWVNYHLQLFFVRVPQLAGLKVSMTWQHNTIYNSTAATANMQERLLCLHLFARQDKWTLIFYALNVKVNSRIIKWRTVHGYWLFQKIIWLGLIMIFFEWFGLVLKMYLLHHNIADAPWWYSKWNWQHCHPSLCTCSGSVWRRILL